MAKRSREDRDAARARKQASGQFKKNFPAAANQGETEPSEVKTPRFPNMTYPEVIADSLSYVDCDDLGLSPSDSKIVKDILRVLSDDENLEIAEPGEETLNYMLDEVRHLAVYLRVIVNSEIRIACRSANVHLREHAAFEMG